MGWKNIKTAFSIEHIVAVEGGNVVIGSGYLPKLIVIDTQTGEISTSEGFSHFLDEEYPELKKADPAYLKELFDKPDTFDNNIVVYTYDDDGLIDKRCEETGFPNVTHDGCLMYENTYSTDKEKIIERAKEDNRLAIKMTRESIERLEADIASYREDLSRYERTKNKLENIK